MAAKTISFPKGKGSLTHNNRDFIAANVDSTRSSWNRIYKQESLNEAYDHCFGEAIRQYNEKQKRSDRKIDNYVEKLKYSGNKEKLFYENIVQIGTKNDTGVVDAEGNLTENAKEAVEILDWYAKSFQERNPNLYVFNCVMHLDEATPHLHIDYIPVAHDYKTGLETRNSLTKAFQQMGFSKAVSRKQNETVAWQTRERAAIGHMCNSRGIEIEVLGEKRENYSLPEYKEAMKAVEGLQAERSELEQEKVFLEEKAKEVQKQIKVSKEELARYELRSETQALVEKVVNADIKKAQGIAIPSKNLMDREEYVKIKKKDWNVIIETLRWAFSKKKVVESYEKKISVLEGKVSMLQQKVSKYMQFIKTNGMTEMWNKFLQPKSIQRDLEEKKKVIQKHQQYPMRDLGTRKVTNQER